LDPAIHHHWQEAMEEHQAKHPAVTLRMVDGSPVNMQLGIDDIIAFAEENGLVTVEDGEEQPTTAVEPSDRK
ncbi:MAG: hypothetical protein MI702_07065, partial [Chlorobiales bacterium]|nr:hypothetical protein [Chlorobiales bacterium]